MWLLSHPTWVRGLKLQCWLEELDNAVSHPTWVRGLKLLVTTLSVTFLVAPYVGAWIETRSCNNTPNAPTVAPYVGAWIETLENSHCFMNGKRRTLRGCVD